MSNFTGIKTINHEGGNKTFELHWNGTVTTYDTYDAASRVMLGKMQADAGREETSKEEAITDNQSTE